MNFLIPAFILGLFGSLHCIGMCGPLVMSMPFQQVENGQKWLANLNYHLGKTSTYAIMGLFVGILGKTFVLLEWQQILSILSGVFLLLITLLPMLKQKLQWSLPLQSSFAKIYNKMEVSPKPMYFFAFGFVNGLLPCGLVYAALAAAMVTATPIQGMLFMVFFGLGTMPALTSIIILKSKNNFAWRKYITKSSYYISIFVGVLLILRGLNLGIPYVSPGLNAETQEMSCCHKPKH